MIGCAIAFFLTRARPERRVCVIERDPSYTRSSSARSASSIRQQFSTPLSVQMSQFGFEFLRNISANLGVDDEPVEIGLVERGYLVLAGPDGEAALRRDHAMQQALGADIELLDPAALSARFTWLDSRGITVAGYGVHGEGWFDGYALLQAFRNRSKASGVHFVTADVVGFATRGSRIGHAITNRGGHVTADMFVNAAGPWAAALCRLLDLDLPVSARKRMVFVFDCAEALTNVPMIFDPSGLWCRPEGTRYLAGKAPPAADDPPDAPLDEVDYGYFEEVIWPLLARRVPAFERLRLTSAWAGYYAFNAFDQNAILGRHPEIDNLLLANGFSGHGMQHAPAVARGIRELIDHGEYRSLDLSPLSIERVRAGTPIVERTVY